MHEVVSYLATFIGGALVASIGYLISFNVKLADLSAQIKVLTKTMDNHLNSEVRKCPAHETILAMLNANDKASAILEERVNTVEESTKP
jgi:hypothetical protein